MSDVFKGAGAETLRVFVALELPPHVKEALQETQARLRERLPESAVRWSSPETFHLTLIFLGKIKAWEADEVAGVMARAAGRTAPLELRASRLGAFPSLARPSVLWVGLEGALDELHTLHAAIKNRLDDRLSGEKGAFKPHLTLGRVAHPSPATWRELASLLATAPDPVPVAWRAEAVTLVRSELRAKGARHTALAEFPFGAD